MDQVAQIRERIDIVSYLSESLTLKKAGRNFKAVCPFHTEKSPSFMVSPDRQVWHCFGCTKGGDIYSFVMEYERVEFPEALRLLAKRAGITLVQSKFETDTSAKKETLGSINRTAAEFYHYVLTKHPAGRQAIAYLTGRGVNAKIMETYLIGFAPRTGSPLTQYLMKKKQYSTADLLDAGLVSQARGDTFDFFRGRLMFPLIDQRDNIVGFSGRILTTGEPKYINTRETLLYHKGDMFFGLHMAKESIRKENQAIVVEGEFDVIACFEEGITNVVALKGTALTEQQVNLLARYAQKVTLCLDSDSAGQEAIKRSLPLLEKKGLTTTVILPPNGKDPDEALKTDAVAFKKAVKQDIGVYDYLLESALKTHNPKTMEGKKAISTTLIRLYREIGNEIVKEHYLKKLSQALDTTYESILKEADRKIQKDVIKLATQEPQKKRTREEVLEEYLVSLIVQHESPQQALEKAVGILSESLEKERAYQKILHHLLDYFTHADTFDRKQFGGVLPSELAQTFDQSLLLPIPQFADSELHAIEIEQVATQLRDIYIKNKITALSERIAEKEDAGSDEDTEQLRTQLSRFVMMLRQKNTERLG